MSEHKCFKHVPQPSTGEFRFTFHESIFLETRQSGQTGTARWLDVWQAADTRCGMTTGSRLLLPLLSLTLIAACADESRTPDATGFSNNDRFEAQMRHQVLPGMPASLVTKMWGPPNNKQAAPNGEKWIYNSGPSTGEFDVHTTVTISQGKVTDVTNGDLMSARWQ